MKPTTYSRWSGWLRVRIRFALIDLRLELAQGQDKACSDWRRVRVGVRVSSIRLAQSVCHPFSRRSGEQPSSLRQHLPQVSFHALRLFPMRFDFELQICIFRSQKRMTLLMQSKYAKSDRKKFDLRIR